ncbi:MAG: hypothetical protein ACOC33_03390 [bacterium]
MNTLLYVIIGLFVFFIIIIIRLLNLINERNEYIKQIQNQCATKISTLRNEHLITLENIRIELLNKEDERMRQWVESERETLQVLNGISQIFELSEDINSNEMNRIIDEINNIKELIENGKN